MRQSKEMNRKTESPKKEQKVHVEMEAHTL